MSVNTALQENETLIVGRFYNVLCAEFKNYTNNKMTYMPVIGSEHKDPEIGADEFHYHIDGRFANKGTVDLNGRSNGAIWTRDSLMYSNSGLGLGRLEGFKVVKMKCKRLTTGTIPPSEITIDWHSRERGPSSWRKWYDKQIGKSCAGKKCPHLGTTMLECEGRLVCPLHNLQADKESEIIIEPIKFEFNYE